MDGCMIKARTKACGFAAVFGVVACAVCCLTCAAAVSSFWCIELHSSLYVWKMKSVLVRPANGIYGTLLSVIGSDRVSAAEGEPRQALVRPAARALDININITKILLRNIVGA